MKYSDMHLYNIRSFYCGLPSLAISLASTVMFIKREGLGVSYTQLQQNLAKYQAWIRQVNIERITASAALN